MRKTMAGLFAGSLLGLAVTLFASGCGHACGDLAAACATCGPRDKSTCDILTTVGSDDACEVVLADFQEACTRLNCAALSELCAKCVDATSKGSCQRIVTNGADSSCQAALASYKQC